MSPSPQRTWRLKRKKQNAESAGEERAKTSKKKGKGKQKVVTTEHIEEEDEAEVLEPEVVDDPKEYDDKSGDEEEDLNMHHAQSVPRTLVAKNDMTCDLLTVFSDKIEVVFKKAKAGASETLLGQWCLICKAKAEKALTEKR